MSMDSVGASGYVCKASDFTKLLPEDKQEAYNTAISEQDFEAVNDILGENTPTNFPTFEGAFILGDEDTSESLERGEIYICFQDDDIYKPKELNFHGEFLKSHGIEPEFERWTIWG